jgi:xanthine/CO dehydrogenase XdhC/CoxF family maturation factor
MAPPDEAGEHRAPQAESGVHTLSRSRRHAVKNWQETAEILALASDPPTGARAALALATVVRIDGSAYRRPGAKLLVHQDGRSTGGVSGGCLEADIREHARAVARSGTARLLHYDTSSDDRAPFGLGLGCGGSVDVLVQPAATPQFLELARVLRGALEGDRPIAVATPLEGAAAGSAVAVAAGGPPVGSTGHPALDLRLAAHAERRLARGESSLEEVEGVRVFTEVLTPPPGLVVFGAGDDAIPLARFALDAGFRVTLVDHRPAFLEAARFPSQAQRLALRPEDLGAASLPLRRESFAVVKTHSLANDREWTRNLVASEVGYIGVLGPRARVLEILRQLGADVDRRVFGPVGLDLGAEGPEQVAVSVVAELLAVRSGRSPGHLRDKRGPIHGS